MEAATAEGSPIAVVIPCFRVKDAIIGVLAAIGPDIAAIYVVDDACPERSGDHVRLNCGDPRVRVLTHAVNQGVGGAMMTGYRAAISDGAGIVVKLDGDGQMDPAQIPGLVAPIAEGLADYTKGNRFFRNYFLRDFSIASLELLFGGALLTSGALFGAWRWHLSYTRGQAASSGTIMLAALPVLVGIQLLLAFLSYDMSRVPRLALHPRIRQLAGGKPPGPRP